MPGWAWALIAVAAVAGVALVVWQALRDHRTRALRDRFGPEYDRTLGDLQSRRDAEAELTARAERRDALEITPLRLIQVVMHDRGYPMDDFDQRAADDATTEDLRRALQHYRALFDELVEESADAPLSRDPATADAEVPAWR